MSEAILVLESSNGCGKEESHFLLKSPNEFGHQHRELEAPVSLGILLESTLSTFDLIDFESSLVKNVESHLTLGSLVT